jgi:hypothetical protein
MDELLVMESLAMYFKSVGFDEPQIERITQCFKLLELTRGEFFAKAERIRKKKHRVFIPSSDIKLCYSDKFIIQKLEYIHANPLTGKWNLASIPVDYLHSSASYYELNKENPFIKLTHYKELTE